MQSYVKRVRKYPVRRPYGSVPRYVRTAPKKYRRVQKRVPWKRGKAVRRFSPYSR